MSRHVPGQPSDRLAWLTEWFKARPDQWYHIMSVDFTTAYFLATGVTPYPRPWGSYNELLRREMGLLAETGVLKRRPRTTPGTFGQRGPSFRWEYGWNG